MISIGLISCISSGTYDTMVHKRDSLQLVSDSLNNALNIANSTIKQLNDKIKQANEDLAKLRTDYKTLNENYQKLKKNSSSTAQQLMDNLEKIQKDYANKQKEMFDMQDKMDKIQKKLKAREEAINNLKAKLQDALLGFADKGMTVSIKNGKVYVSLSNQLLFKSGSTDIDKKGKEALLELAKVLNQQNDLNILVEGHTDNQQVRQGARFKDNWDLSVLRATEVVRFLTVKGEVAPTRIIASGRSEYFPIEKGDTPEARASNRRTEIILTPKLQELMDIINGG